jgi:hypothetical protein
MLPCFALCLIFRRKEISAALLQGAIWDRMEGKEIAVLQGARMDGVEISARFALPPNSREYCGVGSFAETFSRYLSKKSRANCLALEKSLSSFRAHYAYLRLIARKNGRKAFDYEVSEALWLGNSLLGKVKLEDLTGTINGKFVGKGMLSPQRAQSISSSVSARFLAHHTFHVLHLHTITGVIAPTVANADKCRVSWGRVRKAGKGHVDVLAQRLAKRKGKLVLLPCRRRWKTSCAGIPLVPDAKKGDFVAAHWGVAVMGISARQRAWLKRATLRNMAAENSLAR